MQPAYHRHDPHLIDSWRCMPPTRCGPAPASATGPPSRCWSARDPLECVSWRPSAPSSTATTGACGSSPARAATRRPGWCTPAGRPPVPRWNAPSSMPSGATATRIWEGWFALDLIVESGRCRGVTALDPDGNVVELRAAHTLLATGGAGQLFSVTTNPPQSTGDGVAMALRAGVPVADVEFVQFHPTALHGSTAGPRPLLSEALRGEGALLRDHRGRRFVDELQPRDVVAAAVAARIREDGVEHVWLDVAAVPDFGAPLPHAGGGRAGPGVRPCPRLAAGRPGRPLPLRRRADRPGRGHRPARSVGRRRGRLHRRPRRQPAGIELAARRDGLRRPGGGGRAFGKGRAQRDRRPPPPVTAGRVRTRSDRRALAPDPTPPNGAPRSPPTPSRAGNCSSGR